jgi:hypothetical protein
MGMFWNMFYDYFLMGWGNGTNTNGADHANLHPMMDAFFMIFMTTV